MRQQYTHTKTHTEDFCPSSASGLGQLCCASQPRVSSPVSQAAEAPQGTTNSWQTGATAIYHPNHTYACVSLPVFVCRCILLNHKHGNPSCSRVCVERTGTNKHEAASCQKETYKLAVNQCTAAKAKPLLCSKAKIRCFYCMCVCVRAHVCVLGRQGELCIKAEPWA